MQLTHQQGNPLRLLWAWDKQVGAVMGGPDGGLYVLPWKEGLACESKARRSRLAHLPLIAPWVVRVAPRLTPPVCTLYPINYLECVALDGADPTEGAEVVTLFPATPLPETIVMAAYCSRYQAWVIDPAVLVGGQYLRHTTPGYDAYYHRAGRT